MRLVGYARVSTAKQATDESAGLEAQRRSVEAACSFRGYELVGWFEDVESGAKRVRVGLDAALAVIERGEAEGIIVAKLDRLTRSLADFVDLLALSRKRGWQIVTADLQLDTSTPTGEMVVSVLAVFSQFERRMISQRTREGLAVIREREPDKFLRPERRVDDGVVDVVRSLRAEGLSLRGIAARLEADGVATAQGGGWYPSTVRYLLESR